MQAVDHVDRHALDEQRLIGIAARDEDRGQPLLSRGDDHRQDAAHRTALALEREFRRKERSLEAVCRHDAIGRQEAHGNRQVEPRAVLADAGRREVYRDLLLTQLDAGIAYGRAHALLRLAHRCVGQPDDVKGGQSRRRVDFHRNDEAVDSHRRAAK